MIDTNWLWIIRRIKEKKQELLQRLVLDINPESEEKKYTRNSVIKLSLSKIDEVIDELLQEEKKANHDLFTNWKIKEKLFQTRKKEIDEIKENLHNVEISTDFTRVKKVK